MILLRKGFTAASRKTFMPFYRQCAVLHMMPEVQRLSRMILPSRSRKEVRPIRSRCFADLDSIGENRACWSRLASGVRGPGKKIWRRDAFAPIATNTSWKQNSSSPAAPRKVALPRGRRDRLPLYTFSEVGGDFVDFFALPNGFVGIYLGDVVGKGLPAAMCAALVIGTLRGIHKSGTDTDSVLARLNERCCSGRSLAGSARRYTPFSILPRANSSSPTPECRSPCWFPEAYAGS